MANANTNAPDRNHSAWIDILRGFAAMCVIVYHSRVDLWVGYHAIQTSPGDYSLADRLAAWLSFPAACGGSAVMLFFLISGFCVHLPYAGGNRPFNLVEYGLRRAFRILPPYLFAVILTCLLEWWAYSLGGMPPTSWPMVGRVALLIQNYGPHAGQLLTNGSLWSLPVEVELYVAFLLFYPLLRSFGGWVSLTFVSILSLIAAVAYFVGVPYLGQNFVFFWAMWCAGAMLAEGFRRGTLPRFRAWNGIAFLLLLALSAWGESRQWHLAILTYLWAAAYFHVVWLALLNPGVLLRFPSRLVRLLAGMGIVSYSAYLIHGPIFAFCGFLWVKFAGNKPASYFVPLLFSIGVWPLAWLFWKFCELPFHQLAQRLAKRRAARGTLRQPADEYAARVIAK
jgi:peptidoglycan/LPS O-acetylase OafA/YrhL